MSAVTPELRVPHAATRWVSEPRYGPWPEDPVNAQAPSLYYRHPATGHEVSVVGVWHGASAECWWILRRELYAWIDSGAVVQMEHQDSEWAGRRITARADAMHWLLRRVYDSGLVEPDTDPAEDAVPRVDQHEAIAFDPRIAAAGYLVDAPMAHTYRYVSTISMTAAGLALLCAPVRWLLRRRRVTAEQLEQWLEERGVLPSMAQILDERDEIAAEAIVEESRPVVSIWGAAHLPGIDRHLQAAGYELLHWRARQILREEPSAQ